MTSWNCLNFQNANSYMMLEFIFFHDFINCILMFIMSVVSFVMFMLVMNNMLNLFLMENQNLESIWILVPSLILLKIGIPSLYLLYMTDDLINSSVSLKVNGNQWYWSYEYTDFWTEIFDSSMEFNSYMVSEKELDLGMIRLLETDNRPILPYLVQSRVMITSLDVLHSWTVPSLGVKVDANPGRVNQVSFYAYQPGIYFGQCSEICGANHSFMPISLEIFNVEIFLAWVMLNSHD